MSHGREERIRRQRAADKRTPCSHHRRKVMSTSSATRSRRRARRNSTRSAFSLSYPHYFTSKAQLWPHPFGEAADCVVCLGRAASHHLEAVQHLRKDIEPDFDTRLTGSLGKHPAVIDKGLVASGLQVDRRESSKIRMKRAGIWIAPVAVAEQIRRQPLHCRFREEGILLTVGDEAGPGHRQIKPARHDHCGSWLRQGSF